jgi:hypothetical protein
MIDRDDETFKFDWNDSPIKKNAVRRAWVVLATHCVTPHSEMPVPKEANHA